MNAADFPGLQRRPDTQEIDVKSSLNTFAHAVIALKEEEGKLRKNRRYKSAVLKAFKESQGFKIKGYYDGEMFYHLKPLVSSVVRKLRHKKEDALRIWDEVERHILLNNKRYLRVVTVGDNTHVLLVK